jgi:signal transduction histidine kinase
VIRLPSLWSVIVAAAMIGLSVLFVVSRPPSTEVHIGVVDGLGRIRETEERLSRTLLQARAGELENYDPILTEVQNVDRVVAATQTALAAAELNPAALTDYVALSALRKQDVERFTSADALYKNSLVYLPTLARDLAGLARRERLDGIARQIESWESLLYLTLYNRTSERELDAASASLRSALAIIPGVEEDSRLLFAHGDMLLRTNSRVKSLLSSVLSLSRGSLINQVYDSYMHGYRTHQAAARIYELVLYFAALLCVAGIFFAMSRLRRTSSRLRDSNRLLDARAAELEQAGQELRHEIAERHEAEAAKERLQRQLYQTQKIESLGTLAGGIAHEMNNALVPVLALTQMTIDDLPADSAMRVDLEMIHEAGKRAEDLVSQILAFSRAESCERGDLDLAATVQTSLPLLRAMLPASVRLDAELDPVSFIDGNAGQLHQVLINMVSNASHAIGDGTGSITISVGTAKAKSGSDLGALECVRLAIADTGCGMAPETIGRIFDPFFTTKPVGEGTGLGLTVAHSIVTEHGGHIDVTSRPGQGTRFEIQFPIARTSAAQVTPPERLMA